MSSNTPMKRAQEVLNNLRDKTTSVSRTKAVVMAFCESAGLSGVQSVLPEVTEMGKMTSDQRAEIFLDSMRKACRDTVKRTLLEKTKRLQEKEIEEWVDQTTSHL